MKKRDYFQIANSSGHCLLIGLLIVGVGCASRPPWNESDAKSVVITNKISGHFSISSKEGPPLKLVEEELDQYVEIERSNGPVSVKGPANCRKLIESLAEIGGETLVATERELGIESDVEMHLILIPVDSKTYPSSFEYKISCEENTPTYCVLLDRNIRNVADLLQADDSMQYQMCGHEHFEISLISTEGNMRLLGDSEIEYENGFTTKTRAYTRWYRDGFATYAANIWFDKLCDEAGVSSEKSRKLFPPDTARESLSKVGTKMFRWTQFKPDETQPLYEASYGLFLKLEEEFGRAKIREWNEGISKSPEHFRIGSDLLKSGRQVFGVNLPSFARKG